MENIDQILEKLTLNRTKLMMTRFDQQLKDIIESDLQAFKAQHSGKRNRKAA